MPILRWRRLVLQTFFRMMIVERMSRGLCGPRTPCSRAIGPAPFLRYRRRLFHSSFRMWLGDGEAGACAAPVPPRQGHCPWTRSAIEKTDCINFFPHEALENGKRAHGRYENEENAGGESLLSLPAYFFRFPRMHSIRSAVFHTASPWAGVSGASSSQRNNLFLQRGFCVAAVPHPTRKVSTVLL